MWSTVKQEIEKGTVKYTFHSDNKSLNNREILDLLRSSKGFVGFFVEVLKESSFEAYFWEVKPVMLANMEEKFECVLIDNPILARIQSDNSAFLTYFHGNEWVTSFSNLTGDSRLVVPVEIDNAGYYAHLAKFVRNAPQKQVEAFWEKVSEEFGKSIGTKAKWLSTSGLGVPWLHVRIDSKPKYYNYLAYKRI